jgi:cell division protease FtsH
MNPQWLRNSFVYLLVIAVVLFAFFALFPRSYDTEVPISEVIDLAKANSLQKIKVDDERLTITTKDGDVLTSRKEASANILAILEDAEVNIGKNGVDIEVAGSSGISNIFGILMGFLPLVFFGAVLLFMMRQAQGNSNQTLGFGRSKARLFVANRSTVTFSDVAGIQEAKTELEEIVDYLKSPERFAALGARIPRGVLLVGAPGTGKTLLSRAVAGEAGVPFFSISGSEFVEMFVGVGAARVRDLFDQAKRNSPCIVFIDEIDAVGRQRGAGLGGGHDEREQTLNQILVEMDGFDTDTNIIVIAATNRPDILDPALLRPGRFDRRVIIDLPDVQGRRAILTVHSKGKPLDSTVDLELVAKQTAGFSGADLANLVNEAAILAARSSKKTVTPEEFAEAVDRVVAGPERKSRVISPKEKEIAAFHEAGHALVAHILPNADPVQKISIIPRGAMGGYTRMLPSEETHMYTKAQFEDMIAVAMGGRVAEEMMFQSITTGASNDIEKATTIARRMVTQYGMSETINYIDKPISELLEDISSENIESIEIYGNDLLVSTKANHKYRTYKEEEFSLIEFLQNKQGTTSKNGIRLFVKKTKRLGGLGPRTFGKKEELIFLGREISEQRDYSDRTAEEIDDEVHNFVMTAYGRAKEILMSSKSKLTQVSRYLIANESVEGDDLKRLFDSIAPNIEDMPQTVLS